jgi:hypothetical protein
MKDRALTVETFLALVTERVRYYGERMGLGAIEPSGRGCWRRRSAYASLLQLPGREGLHLLLDVTPTNGRSKILKPVGTTEAEAEMAADKIVSYLLFWERKAQLTS